MARQRIGKDKRSLQREQLIPRPENSKDQGSKRSSVKVGISWRGTQDQIIQQNLTDYGKDCAFHPINRS